MKCLSLTQPWATLVAIGAKHLETRSWHTMYRGPLAIHAAKRFPQSTRRLVIQEPFMQFLSPFTPPTGWGNEECATGAIIAVVELTDCWPTGGPWPVPYDRYLVKPGYPESAFGDYSGGRWVWKLERPRLLTAPWPYKGRLGLFDVPSEVLQGLTSSARGV